MSQSYPQFSKTNFPNSLDQYIVFTDVTASNKQYVDLYYSYFNASNFTAAAQVLADHPELKTCIINADTMQRIYDMLLAIETTWSSNIQTTVGEVVKYRGDFSTTQTYALFNIVKYVGKAYMCIKADCPSGTLPTNTTYWTVMTLVGVSGTGMAFHTSWDSTHAYVTEDCVPYSNKLYVCIQNNVNQTPSTSPDYWVSVVTVPKQVIFSDNQPESQEAGDIWNQTNSANTSFITKILQNNGQYADKYPQTKGDFVDYGDVPSKVTPVDADSIALVDSADGGKIKKLLWSKIRTLFAAKSHTHAEADFTGTLSAGKGGTGVTSLSDLLSSLNVLGAGTVITGGYSGNGQAYDGNTGDLQTSIPFSSRPKLVIITTCGSNAISAFGILVRAWSGEYGGTSLTRMTNTVTPDECPIMGAHYDGTLKFRSYNATGGYGTAAQQLNLNNVYYYYVAIF